MNSDACSLAAAPPVACDNTKSHYRCSLQQLLLCISEKGTEEPSLAVPERMRDLPRPWKQSPCPETQSAVPQRVTGLTSQKAHNRKQLQAEQLLSFRAFISFPSGRMQRKGAKNANTTSISVPQDTRSGHSVRNVSNTAVSGRQKAALTFFPNSKAA